jgi:hypothetical protein
MLIGLIGKKSSGKDTFGNILINQYNFQKRAFADPLKDCCQLLFNLSKEDLNDPILKEKTNSFWNKSPRQILQIVGTDLFRNHFDKNFWLKLFEQWYLNNQKFNIVCTDVRYQNEAELIKKLGGIIIKIERPLLQNNDNHDSEKLDINFNDYLIYNDSTLEDYEIKIIDLCNLILGNSF